MSGFLPDTDAELVQWGQTFNTVGLARIADLKMTAAEFKVFTDAYNAFVAARTDATNKRAAAKAATVTQNTTKSAFESTARTFNTRIQGTPGVTDALKTELGLTVRKPRSVTSPNVPIDLTVNGYQDGNNILKWRANGNIAGTKYLIEAMAPGGEWKMIDTVTSTNYIHEGQTPGVQIAYRVRAKRRTIFSPYSNAVTAYEDASPSLSLSKAA